MDEELIEIAMTDGGVAQAYVARPVGMGTAPGVLFLIDAIGLRPQTQAMAQRIVSWGYVVLAPNTLWRSGTAAQTRPEGDLQADGARAAFMRAAMGRVAQLTRDRLTLDLADYLTALTALPGVRVPVGVTGYCMGARLAVQATIEHPEIVAACGGFHGGRLATEEPDSLHRHIHSARAEFVFGHADGDRSMDAAAVARLGQALDDAGLRAVNEIRPGAAHGYTMADTPVFDDAATEWHFAALRDLFSRTLR